MSIYVGNLSLEVSEQDLNSVFAEYGSVRRVHLPTDRPWRAFGDRDTGRVRGFGFVEMETLTQEDAAISALDGSEWMGRSLKVNQAKPREERGSNGGGRRNRF
jgi:RNA recognition motif-containing protein